MKKIEAEMLAKRVGMTKILGTLRGCIIGYVPGFKGVSICNAQRGVVASGFYNFTMATKYINGQLN